MGHKRKFTWLAVSVKVLFLALFIWMTNAGMHDRIMLLIAQERIRASFLYVGLWGACIVCLLIVAFHPRWRWRVFWACLIAASTFGGYLFMRISGSQLTVFQVISLWAATADADRALSFYAKDILLSAAIALFGFAVFVMKPPRMAPVLDRLLRLFSFAPAVPFLRWSE